jgi:Domain of unknown function (DUF4832)/Domain of unknown function (DUF4874)
MKQFVSFFFLLSIMTSCSSPQNASEPAGVSHTYVVSDAPILNPERGFFTPYELPGSAGFSPVRATGNTLVHLNIRLDDWRETDIPQEVLDGLQTNFDDMRDAGVKAIIRFAYNAGPYPDSEPDASKKQILRHIEQLTPLLQKSADVIAWVEAGFIGAWGEWHTSTNGLDNLADKRDILTALVAAIPNRYVQVRYPANIIEMFPNPMDAVKARVAHHNDCFLSSDTDVGTYERDGVMTIERDQKYLAELTRFTPMSGETCAPFPPRSECASAIQEMELLHFSAINEAYHKGILRSWEEGGCLEEINNRMGYRLSLTSAEFNEQVRPGGVLNLKINLQNTGFASMINERPVFAVLIGPDARSVPPYEVQLDIDPRQWEPGTATFTAKLHIPSNTDEGEYQFALWLPDADESLQDNPLYSVRFANENVWDESTGFNVLGTVIVTKQAGGIYQRGEMLEVIESSTSVERSVVSSLSVADATFTSAPASSDLIFNTNIVNDAETLVVQFGFAGDPASYNGFQVLVDADQSIQTGLSIEGIGADFLLENDSIHSYTGSGSDWKWDPVDVELAFSNEDQIAKWTLPPGAFGDSTNIVVVFQLVDANWDTAFVTSKQPFTLK